MREFNKAMAWWGFEYSVLNLPDMGLTYYLLEEMVKKVGAAVNKLGISSLVSFNPHEITAGFDHPDHNRTGEVVRLVSSGMRGKRGLKLWTSEGRSKMIIERVNYAKKFYPSQNIPKSVLEQLGESYIEVR